MIDRTRTVLALGTAQTLAWASSYFLPAVLATAMALELGVSLPTVFAMFSVALLVAAVVGPPAGRFVDQHGGRRVLLASNSASATTGSTTLPWCNASPVRSGTGHRLPTCPRRCSGYAMV